MANESENEHNSSMALNRAGVTSSRLTVLSALESQLCQASQIDAV